MSDQMDVFVSLSAALTGFDASMFAPSVDPVNLKQVYFDYIMAKDPTNFTVLLDTFAVVTGTGATGGDAWAETVKGGSETVAISAEMVRLAMSINKLWYLGSWYDPEDTTQQEVVSEQSYIRGLSWQVMQSHAMGNSPFTFGYWAKDPAASLALTTGNPDAIGGTS